MKRVKTRTTTIYTETKINIKCPETASGCTSRGLKLHDSYPELNSAYESCSFSPREVHPEAVSVHFYIYLCLGIYMVVVCVCTLSIDGFAYDVEFPDRCLHWKMYQGCIKHRLNDHLLNHHLWRECRHAPPPYIPRPR